MYKRNRADDPVRRDDLGRVVDDERSRAPAEQQRVERAQQPRRRHWPGSLTAQLEEPVGPFVQFLRRSPGVPLVRRATSPSPTWPGPGHRPARGPRGNGGLAPQARAGDPASAARPASRRPARTRGRRRCAGRGRAGRRGRPQQHVRDGLPGGRHAGEFEHGADLRSRHRPVIAERRDSAPRADPVPGSPATIESPRRGRPPARRRAVATAAAWPTGLCVGNVAWCRDVFTRIRGWARGCRRRRSRRGI